MLSFLVEWALVALPSFWLYNHLSRPAFKEGFMAFLFCSYLAALFFLTQPVTLFQLITHGIPSMENAINFIPFGPYMDPVQYYLNTLLFLPVGFLVPVLWKSFRPVWKSTLFGFCLSFLIEASQVFNHRQPDIDDLIFNTIGTLFGYLGFYLLRDSFQGSPSRSVSPWKLTAIAFVLHFFLCFS